MACAFHLSDPSMHVLMPPFFSQLNTHVITALLVLYLLAVFVLDLSLRQGQLYLLPNSIRSTISVPFICLPQYDMFFLVYSHLTMLLKKKKIRVYACT